MNSSWFLRPMAVLRITEYPNSIDRFYRELPNTKEKRLFSIYQSVGREKNSGTKGQPCYFRRQGQVRRQKDKEGTGKPKSWWVCGKYPNICSSWVMWMNGETRTTHNRSRTWLNNNAFFLVSCILLFGGVIGAVLGLYGWRVLRICCWWYLRMLQVKETVRKEVEK